jgi:hypothetical protein
MYAGRLAVSTAVTKRLRKWIGVMCLSWRNVVSRGLPLRRRSDVVPVVKVINCVVCNCKQKATSTNNFSTRKSMLRLLQNERQRAVRMFQAGMTQTEIANRFNCSRLTIYRLLVRVRATGTTSDRRRLDSSENIMFCQVFRLHRRRARAHWSLAILCRRFNSIPLRGRYERRPDWRNRLRTVWGISHVGKTNLKIVVGNLNGIRYRDEILAPIVLPFIRTHHFNHVFQQDNARWHISACGMLFHSSVSALWSWSIDSGGLTRLRTRLPSSSHKCSMGFKFGDNAGQGSVRMWLYCLY